MKYEPIIFGKNAKLSEKECIEMMDGRVYQYRKAGNDIYKRGIYTRSRCQAPIEGHPLHTDIYILTDSGITCLCYDISPHRARQALRAYQNRTLDDIDSDVWNNYITNGYTTRRGLFARYGNDTKYRMTNIARSHADHLGNEINSTADHNARIEMRN